MKRELYLQEIINILEIHTICGLLGPRQVGKTTLAKEFIKEYYSSESYFFDLENPEDLLRLENPMLALSNLNQKIIVIDEIQRKPDLFPILRVLVDRNENNQKFLILGSASRDLIRQFSESLAGRIGYIELPPFSLFEVKDSQKLSLRGGFPKSYLAANDKNSYLWRLNYIRTFLEQDIPNLGFNIPPQQMQRLWRMLAHYHGQILNSSEIGKSLGVSHHTVKKYIDILSGTFMLRILYPWFENIHKRQVKSPKIYFRDSGILNALIGIENIEQLQNYPLLGSFWEGFALEEIVRVFNLTNNEYYFWATQSDAELDLLIFKGSKRLGFEFKYSDAPKITKSMHISLNDLKLDHLFIVYPGNKIFLLDKNISLCGLDSIASNEFSEYLLKELKLSLI